MSAAPKKQFGLLDPANLPQGVVRLGRLPDPFANDLSEAVISLFAVEGLFICHWQKLIKADGTIAGVDQFEMPLDGVRWVVTTIEQDFQRKPSEGGLPRDVFHSNTMIAGEHLSLRWGVSVGGEGVGGYTVNNFDRTEYILNRESQRFRFTNDLWHERLHQLFISIAERHEAGEFKPPPPPADPAPT